MEHPEGVACKAEGFPLALQIAAFQGHPTQRAPAPPAQARAVSLPAGLGVLLAHGVDGARMQGKILAAPRSQPIQIKAARPALVPLQSLKLSIVAEIPETKTSIYRNRISPPQARHFIPGASAGVSVPEKR